jgi:hypothetical protein
VTAAVASKGTPCPRCRRATLDGLLCGDCCGVFERAVGDLARFDVDLEVAVARLDVVARAVLRLPDRAAAAAGPVSTLPAWLRSKHGDVTLAGHGVPVNLDAVDLARKVQAVLARWADRLLPAAVPLAGPLCDYVCVHRSCLRIRLAGAPAALRLLGSVLELRRREDAGAAVDEMVKLARSVESMVDRRDADLFCGTCDAVDLAVTDVDGVIGFDLERRCGAELYGRFGDHEVECRVCGWRYPIAARRAWLLDAAREVWDRPVAIARGLAALDVDLTAERLDNWISRDRRRHQSLCLSVTPPWAIPDCTHLWPVALDSDEVNEAGEPMGRPLYRVGDVLDRVEELRARRRVFVERTAVLTAGLEAK